jgi:hypothetical protein
MASSFNWRDKWQRDGLYSHVIEQLAHLCGFEVNGSIHFGLCELWLSWEMAPGMRYIPYYGKINKVVCCGFFVVGVCGFWATCVQCWLPVII